MDNNVKREVFNKYSIEFAKIVTEEYFKRNNEVNSKDIMHVQNIKQINLFVVKNLYDQWQREAHRLRSPYFNYTNKEVQDAMQAFMNTLSHHIALDKSTYQQLAEKSTEETLLLIFSPYDFYFRLLSEYDEQVIPVSYLTYVLKYIKINPFILKHLLDITSEQQQDEIKREDIQALLDKSLERTVESPEDIESFLAEFSEVKKLTSEDIYGKEKFQPEKKEANVSEERKENDPVDISSDQPSEPSLEAPISDTKYHFDPPENETLNDKLKSSAPDEVPSLANRHMNSKIENIRKSLSINQRFMFINALFQGNEDAFNRTVEHIEEVSSSDEAISFLTHKFSNWDMESEEVEEFIQLVKRRHN